MEFKKRFTAYKYAIKKLLEGQPRFENDKFKELIIDEKPVSRVNIMANVVDKFESEQGNYVSTTVDDGSGTIRIKAFAQGVGMLKTFSVGDSLMIIGVLREYNKEVYITPEIVKKVDARWLMARKLELGEEITELPKVQTPKEIKEEIVEETIPVEKTIREKIIDLVKEKEEEGGIKIDEVIMALKEPVEHINKDIKDLLEEGTIYEPQPGKLRIL
ncbi:MAG: OB-fold nucleic acid binding domain-containing protein [archaeon]